MIVVRKIEKQEKGKIMEEKARLSVSQHQDSVA
jgi:hypothetical protein